MKAAVLVRRGSLGIRDVPGPTPGPGQVLLKVRACGVCRTDLHIVDGELPPLRDLLIPGHQIVGEVVDGDSAISRGTRAGISWVGGVDGSCLYCQRGMENLCDNAVFTGY